MIADKDSAAALGTVAIDIDDEGTGVLGYWLARDHWGRGLAKEAVGTLVHHAKGHPTLRRLVAVTDPDNLRSQHVLSAWGLSNRGLKDRRPPSRRGSTRILEYELVLERR